MDGSIKTFFAPGQTEFSLMEYDNPTAWRPQGSLLKMPQVVWLSCHMPYASADTAFIPPEDDFHTAWRDPLEPDESWLPFYNGVWSGGGSGFDRGVVSTTYAYITPVPVEYMWAVDRYDGQGNITGSGPMSVWMDGGYLADYWVIDDRAYYDARGEFNTVLQSVKSSIESIRPGKTWVYVNHWWFTQVPMFDTCTHMIAPPTDSPYVGTDFLHMYFGAVAYQGTDWGGPGFGEFDGMTPMYGRPYRITPWFEPEPEQGVVTFMKGMVYDASLARVQAAQDRFAGFRVMLFGHDVPITVYVGADQVPMPFDGISVAHTAFLQQQGTDLAEYGYSYEGMGTGISVDTIKNKIAAHFGFNPSTGADL